MTTSRRLLLLSVSAGAGHVRAAQAIEAAARARRGIEVTPLGLLTLVPDAVICTHFLPAELLSRATRLSTSECLAMGLPMQLISPIPGHLLEQGAAWLAMDELAPAWRMQQLLAAPDMLSRLHQRARALGRSRAAGHVLDAVFGPA